MVDHSFVVIAYKNSPYLGFCLESLLLQKVRSKILISTSTPSDHINTIASHYGVQVVVNESRRGISDDWNFALALARTKYVTLAHQDDIYLPEYTLKCLQAAKRFEDTLICFTDYGELLFDNETSKSYMLYVKEWIIKFFMPFRRDVSSPFGKRLLLRFGNPIACPSVMYNMELLKDFRFSNSYSISLDWEAWYRLTAFGGRFVYVPEVLMKHRIHEESETTAGLESNIRQSEDLEMFKKMWPPVIARFFVKLYSGSYASNQRKIK